MFPWLDEAINNKNEKEGALICTGCFMRVVPINKLIISFILDFRKLVMKSKKFQESGKFYLDHFLTRNFSSIHFLIEMEKWVYFYNFTPKNYINKLGINNFTTKQAHFTWQCFLLGLKPFNNHKVAAYALFGHI